MQRHVLFPIDSTESSAKCIAWAKSLILSPDDRISIVHCRPFSFDIERDYESPFIFPGEIEATEKRLKDFSDLVTKEASKSLSPMPVEVVQLQGDTRKQLEDFVKSEKPDLIIMSSRGLGIVSSMLMGSTSNHLLMHSGLPVLIFK